MSLLFIFRPVLRLLSFFRLAFVALALAGAASAADAPIPLWPDVAPGSKAKPPGVKRAILLLKIGAIPTGPSDMAEVAADTATPYLNSFDEADAGKTAHWAVCWENSSMQRGPCSAVSSWTIPG